MTYGRRGFAVLLGVAGCLVSARARAQGVPEAAYDDVKQIIEDLITAEVAHTVVPRMACMSHARRLAADENAETSNALDITTDLIRAKQARAGDTFVALDAVRYFPRTLQAIYDRQFTTLRPIIVAEVSDMAASTVYEALRTEPGQGDSVAKRLDARQVVRANGDRPAPAAQLAADSLDTCADNLGAKLAERTLAGPTPLDAYCKAPTGPTPDDEYACDLAYAMQFTLGADAKKAEGYLLRVLAEFVAEVAMAKPPTDAQFAPILNVLAAMVAAPGSTPAIVDEAVLRLTKALGIDDGKRLVPVLASFVEQWKVLTLTSGKVVSFEAFSRSLSDLAFADGQALPGASGLAALVRAGCTLAPNARACTFLPKATRLLSTGSQLWTMVRLTGSADVVDAAQLAIESMFVELRARCASDPKPAGSVCKELPVYERFADAIVIYAVQAHARGTPTTEARADLRSAAVELVRQLGTEGGIDRAWGWNVLFPALSLRYDWSPGFVTGSPGSGRAVASATWLTVRVPVVYRPVAYSALSLSLVDLLAPLAELAMRSGTNAQYADTQKVWLDLLSPHVDVEVGMPSLSKHLLLGAGLSYRWVVPWQTTLATPTTPASYRYATCFDRKSQSECFELGVFAKYLL